VILCIFIVSCKEKKIGKIVVNSQEFTLRQDSAFAYVIDATGTVKNTGEVDVKNIVVTGNCTSCGREMIAGSWFVNDLEKTPEQKDIISYLGPGDEESFKIRDVAFIYNKEPQPPESMPEFLETQIMSFQTVEE
jgi:hypothetical protein